MSGLPIYFEHDLYGARDMDRPGKRVETSAAYAASWKKTFGITSVKFQSSHFGNDIWHVAKGTGVSSLPTSMCAFLFGTEVGFGAGAESFMLEALPSSPARPLSCVEAKSITPEASLSFLPGSPFGAVAESNKLEASHSFLAVSHRPGECQTPMAEAADEGSFLPPINLRSSDGQIQAGKIADVGDLFEYKIPAKITIRSGDSGLVSLIYVPVEGGQVDIYSQAMRVGSPPSAVRRKNTSHATFEGGALPYLNIGD